MKEEDALVSFLLYLLNAFAHFTCWLDLNSISSSSAFELLKEIDPIASNRIHPNDHRKVRYFATFCSPFVIFLITNVFYGPFEFWRIKEKGTNQLALINDPFRSIRKSIIVYPFYILVFQNAYIPNLVIKITVFYFTDSVDCITGMLFLLFLVI